uniref:Uncharacterized protein n=1 Tax=viral metagenome TaxID=1070528 RepID=A0A6M3J9A4_9ZZZZ
MSGYEIAVLVLMICLALAGGKIKALIKESHELLEVIDDALADNKISQAELSAIVKEAKDVGTAILSIGSLLVKRNR